MLAKEVVSRQISNAFENRTNAEAALRTMGLDPRLLRGTAPINDDVPPNGITNLTATPIYAGMRLAWDTPPLEDAVRSTVVEITPEGQDTYTYTSTEITGLAIFGLDGGNHTFRVMLVDEWGLESEWSEYITAQPITTAQTDIDLAYMQQQGRLQNLIEAINLAGPTALQGIQGTALAATLAQNMLPWAESDIEMWTGSVWPPTEAVLADESKVIDTEVDTGHTLSIEVHEASRKIKHVRATPSTDAAYYQSLWSPLRQALPNRTYIVQATVSGPPGTTVSIGVQVASDLDGNNPSLAAIETVTLGGGTQKVYCMFAGSPGKPYFRIRLGNHTDNSTVYWYRFMAEEARLGATEPSPWNAGVVAAGSVSARALTAISANIADAMFERGAIGDAIIGSLKVDKLLGGDIKANMIMAEGTLVAAGATIDNKGIYLKNQTGNPEGNSGKNGFPTEDSVGDWITSNPIAGEEDRPHSGIGFFDDTNDPKRGIMIRARGVPDRAKAGFIDLTATASSFNTSAETSAFVRIRGGKNPDGSRPVEPGTVVIGQHLIVSGRIDLPNNAINSDEIAGLDVHRLTGGGEGHNIDPSLIPNIAGLNGDLPWGRVTDRPDMSKYVTGQELGNKGYRDAEGVRSIVRDMVKEGSLK